MQKKGIRYLLYFIIILAGVYIFVENGAIIKSFIIAVTATILGALLDLLFSKNNNTE
ncbi:hypothetical protein [Enterococcus sp. CWB-B31]|uniref:hypothetical protein n=1 Tax=Enterococcus sp. CWB-B31 TaxID=2885159 RepID=UPI001E4E60AB|nr:hypothetical protein [Enterococcus sp. CWB-B31]MCB5956404.1 hypothetical protein [Enterococcus sp. CWB-B31]